MVAINKLKKIAKHGKSARMKAVRFLLVFSSTLLTNTLVVPRYIGKLCCDLVHV